MRFRDRLWILAHALWETAKEDPVMAAVWAVIGFATLMLAIWIIGWL